MKPATFQAAIRWANVLTVVLFLGSGLAVVLAAVPVPVVFLAAALLGLLSLRRRAPPTDHGSARTASAADIPELLPDRGEVVVGELVGPKPGKWAAVKTVLDPDEPHAAANRAFDAAFRRAGAPPPLVHLNTTVHLSVYASTGAGKSWSLALPFLTRHPHSIVALDVKGELFLKSRMDRVRARPAGPLPRPVGGRGRDRHVQPDSMD